MSTTRILTIASLKMFIRNKQALFFTLFSPLLIMVIFGFIGFDKPSKIDVGLTHAEFNQPTQQFVDQIKAFPNFDVHEGNENDELVALSKGDRPIVLTIPADFITSAMIESGSMPSPQSIIAYVNKGKEGEARTILSILNQFLDKTTLGMVHAPTLFTIEERDVNARNLRYIDFLIPGLIAMAIMQMSVFSVAFVFTQYKEKGVLKRLLATPMEPMQFVTANIITRLVVAIIQAAIFIVVSLLLFNVHIIGSYWLLLLGITLGSLMFLGLGFTISGLSSTVETVPAFANLIVFPMLFLSGTFFSIDNMPAWLRAFAQFLPLTYFSDAVRRVMTEGAHFLEIRGDLLGMAIWAIILIGLATITFSFQEKRQG